MKLMTPRLVLACGAAMISIATGSHAATIQLFDLGGVAGSQAEQGFNIAAAYWGSVLTNNATINLGVGFAALDEGVIGSTGSARSDYDLQTWENRIAATKSNSTLDRNIVLPTLNGSGGATFISSGVLPDGNDDTADVDVVLGDTTSSQTLYMNRAVIKAVGGTAAFNPNGLDGSVTFSNTFGFDFNPTNGINADTFDFIGVAIHEIGHALGFVSGVDLLDYYGAPNGPGAGELGYSLNDTSIYSALDMFRYSKDPAGLIRGNDGVLDLSVGTETYFSIDGGKTALFDNSLSTGSFNGNEDQASHWKDAEGANRCGPQLGIMDPTFCFGQTGEVTALDLAAFDAMGWNIAFDVLANSNYVATTSSIYSMFAPPAVPEPASWMTMILGFGLIGGVMRHRVKTVRFAAA